MQGLIGSDSDIAEKLAAMHTSSSIEEEDKTAEITPEQALESISNFIPRSVPGPSFMERKLQHLRVSCTGIISAQASASIEIIFWK